MVNLYKLLINDLPHSQVSINTSTWTSSWKQASFILKNASIKNCSSEFFITPGFSTITEFKILPNIFILFSKVRLEFFLWDVA